MQRPEDRSTQACAVQAEVAQVQKCLRTTDDYCFVVRQTFFQISISPEIPLIHASCGDNLSAAHKVLHVPSKHLPHNPTHSTSTPYPGGAVPYNAHCHLVLRCCTNSPRGPTKHEWLVVLTVGESSSPQQYQDGRVLGEQNCNECSHFAATAPRSLVHLTSSVIGTAGPRGFLVRSSEK